MVQESIKELRFVDLFAGLGGFHLALSDLGHKCVFACEIQKELRESYFGNFGIMPDGDIRQISVEDVPRHEILCAGFPCQSFSKAGFQEGLNDKERGALFYELMKIIKHHKPKYLLLENVPNIKKHDSGKTWEKIEALLTGEGYDVSTEDFSPHHFGIPQIRLRTYIVAVRGKLNGFKWPVHMEIKQPSSILSILDKNPKNARLLPINIRKCFQVWQELLDLLPNDEKIPHPLWAMEFGANYPYESSTPHKIKYSELKNYRGSFGKKLVGKNRKELFQNLPSHAIRPDTKFPRWKINMIRRNREFYLRNKKILDSWIPKILVFPSSFQKLEWNVGDGTRKLNKYIIQCRASGIRVKKLTTSPSLVAMNLSQIPIIPWENRYMTSEECIKLQSMEKLKVLPSQRSKVYVALGNAVNVEVVKLIASCLLNGGNHNDKQTSNN